MKNKKGFTLIELLAVIVILGIILTIAGTSVYNAIKTSKENAKFAAAKEIVEIADAYLAENPYEDDGLTKKTIVTVKELCDEGYLEEDATNPRTGENNLCTTDKQIAVAILDDNFCDQYKSFDNDGCNDSKIQFDDGNRGYKINNYGIIIESSSGKIKTKLTIESFKPPQVFQGEGGTIDIDVDSVSDAFSQQKCKAELKNNSLYSYLIKKEIINPLTKEAFIESDFDSDNIIFIKGKDVDNNYYIGVDDNENYEDYEDLDNSNNFDYSCQKENDKYAHYYYHSDSSCGIKILTDEGC